MSSNFGSLGDLFPKSEIKCRIRGCNNMVVLEGERAMRQKVTGGDHSHHDGLMCDSCFETLHTLQDKEMPCSKPGCTGTWIWNRYQQLEAKVAGRTGESKGYCEACRADMNKGEDKQIPCRIKGCKNTWTWTRRMQYESVDKQPPARLCDECYKEMRTLKDREIPCRIKGCTRTWKWNVYQQLEQLRAGQSLDNPPQKMCPECLKKFKELSPREMPCKIKGCENTWTYSAFDQLEDWVKTPQGEEPKETSRMCRSCFEFFTKAKPIEVECSNRGCSNKWTWTPGMQLAQKVHGGDQQPPYRMCAECQEKLKTFKDIEEPCSVKGCTGTYVYTAKDQLKAQLTGHRPGARRCKACNEFLASHEAQTITCEKCGKEFSWSPAEQLATSLGVWEKPVVCADCNSRDISQIMPEEPVVHAEEKAFSIQIPTGGPWTANAVIRDWPRLLDMDVVKKMEQAPVRVVCIGDAQTDTGADFAQGWPGLLEKALEAEGTRTAVFNAGIDGCTTELACQRIGRDVAPFAPQWVVFSFAFADTLSRRSIPQNADEMQAALKENAEAFGKFVEAVRALPDAPRLLCWLPNPVFPQKDGMNDGWKANLEPDEAAARFYEANLRQTESLAKKYDVAVVNAHALYLSAGTRSAQSWMRNWYQPNDEGARNIASWINAGMR